MAEDLSGLQQIRGLVKWFDPVKGYGFILSDEGGTDVLLHINVLRNFGQSSVADGAVVEVVTHRTDRGVQAVEVISIAPPECDNSPVLSDLAELNPEDLAATVLTPARVKWFDKAKGFGFANVFGCHDDVFLHIEVLRRSGLADVQTGEALAIREISGQRGKIAVEVMAWEAAVSLLKEHK